MSANPGLFLFLSHTSFSLTSLSGFFRTVSLHLFVVWERKLGRKFKYFSLSCIFLLTILLVALQQRVTGTSYQLGKVCYLNPINGWVTFWMPLLAMALVSFILQVWTLGYCLLNVFRGIWEDRTIAAYNEENNNEDGGGGSSNDNINDENSECRGGNTNESQLSSVRSWRVEEEHGGRRRNSLATQKLLTSMQWRPMFAAFGVLIYVCLITAIFMMLRVEDTSPGEKFEDWVSCIVSSGDKNRCMPYLSHLGPDESFVVVSFFLLAVSPCSSSSWLPALAFYIFHTCFLWKYILILFFFLNDTDSWFLGLIGCDAL